MKGERPEETKKETEKTIWEEEETSKQNTYL